jgi:hypothetical protein
VSELGFTVGLFLVIGRGEDVDETLLGNNLVDCCLSFCLVMTKPARNLLYPRGCLPTLEEGGSTISTQPVTCL